MENAHTPRIAIFGLFLEANSFAPTTKESDFFEEGYWREGDAITDMSRGVSKLPPELTGFYKRMDEIGNWQPVPLVIAEAPPGGPIETSVFEAFKAKLDESLRAVLPVDAIYVCSHGASVAENDMDSDGTLLAMARNIVGPAMPIVVTHDFHCNVSERLVEACNALIVYRTNPHVDMRARGADAADLLHEMLDGMRTTQAFIRLPIVPPLVTQLTTSGPFAELMRLAEERIDPPGKGPIANVSVTGGFAYGDLPKCGMTINVTARDDLGAARKVALEIARLAWAGRNRYATNMIGVADAVETARRSVTPLILADVADNPGGGGRGDTTYLLSALHEARLQNCLLGMQVDPELAAKAHRLGEGQEFHAVFNETETAFGKRFEAEARIDRLTDGRETGRRGAMAGRAFDIGATVLLTLLESGLQVIICSKRMQLCDPEMVEMHGVEIPSQKCLVVKSGGHFRAGFDEFFTAESILEVDAPGLSTSNFSRLEFRKLPRPVVPLDADTDWREPDW